MPSAKNAPLARFHRVYPSLADARLNAKRSLSRVVDAGSQKQVCHAADPVHCNPLAYAKWEAEALHVAEPVLPADSTEAALMPLLYGRSRSG
jgi:hypothetical protein